MPLLLPVRNDGKPVHFYATTIQCEPTVRLADVKNSGLGREGGHVSINELTQPKWITLKQGQMQCRV